MKRIKIKNSITKEMVSFTGLVKWMQENKEYSVFGGYDNGFSCGEDSITNNIQNLKNEYEYLCELVQNKPLKRGECFKKMGWNYLSAINDVNTGQTYINCILIKKSEFNGTIFSSLS